MEDIKNKENKSGNVQVLEQEEIKKEKEQADEKNEIIELDVPKNKDTKIGIILLIIAIVIILVAFVSTFFAAINIKNTKILKGISI